MGSAERKGYWQARGRRRTREIPGAIGVYKTPAAAATIAIATAAAAAVAIAAVTAAVAAAVF